MQDDADLLMTEEVAALLVESGAYGHAGRVFIRMLFTLARAGPGKVGLLEHDGLWRGVTEKEDGYRSIRRPKAFKKWVKKLTEIRYKGEPLLVVWADLETWEMRYKIPGLEDMLYRQVAAQEQV